MPSAIDPDKIPGKDIDPDAIESNASTIKTIAGSVRDNGSNVHLKWQGMAGVYEAPESGTLLGLMQPVSSQATTAGDNLEVVSGALTQFASDVRPIKAELDSLRLQAQAFRDEIAGGVQVRELNPAWVSTQGYYGTTASSSGYSPYSSSSTGGTTTASDIPQYQNVTKEWHEVQEYVDRNNDLISQVNAQQVALWEAERACANTIRALFGGAPLHAYESENDPLGYGLNEIPEGTEMPWGAPVERTEGCGEATAKFVFKDFLWEGVIVGGVWGTIEGLGTLVLGYNPATGDWFSGDAYGAAWGNLGLLVASGVMNSPLLGPLMWADQGMEAFGGGGFLPQEVRDFKAKADEAALNTGKALIAWDKWADDPGTALGESVFNVGTILIPGGAAVTGVKTAGTAASVLSKMARVVDLVDPASLALNGVTRLGGLGLGSLDNIIGNLDLGSKLDAPHIEVYTATDTASAIKALDDWGVDMNSVTAQVDSLGNNVLEFPGGRIELPAGSFDSALGGVRAGDGGVDASVTSPIREPELVSAGVRGETGPGPVNSIVDEAPVRTENGGSGDSTVVRDPETTTGGGESTAVREGAGETGGSGDGAGGGSDDGARPTPSGSDEAGPEWTSGPEHRGDPVESAYGEPRTDHGSLADEFAPPAWEDVRADVRDLVTDPEAPYGRAADGEPYTRSEWEQRYIGPDGYPRYPGNDGAVTGTRVEYTDLTAFRRDYGASFDRLGGDGGKFLSPEGIAFESRALPGGSLNAPYNVFHLGDELPARMKIEVSEIAPAFGQPGGGTQVRFLLGDEVLSIDKLINEYGVLDPSYRTPVDGTAVGASFDGLAAPVPGSPDVQALHAATLSPDVQRALIRHEYPGLLGINSSRFGDPTGAFDVNCTRCVVALDRLFDGAPSSAMPVHTNGALVTDITSALGLKNSFQIVPDYASIVQQMHALPKGSRGIVLVERHTGIGHVFNVVHDGNGVVFLDAQSGRFATLENAARLRLLVTHTGSPS